jgi:hypothetical protein
MDLRWESVSLPYSKTYAMTVQYFDIVASKVDAI